MEKNIGKTKNTLILAIRNVNIFHAIKELIQRTLTVCSAIARFMPLETNAAEISNIMRRDLKIVRIVSYLIRRKLRLCDRKYQELAAMMQKVREADHKMKMSNQRNK